MVYQRRSFLKLAASLSSGIAITAFAGELASCNTSRSAMGKNKELGLQLYTLRDDMPKDPKGVLKKVSEYGYTQIESFEGDKGMFWGMKNTEFNNYIKGLGLTMISSHCDINKDFERKAAEAAEIGMKYLIAPYLGKQKSMDDYKRFAAEFNKRGEVCKKAGLRFAYHNHDYSFVAVNGQFPQDIMMQGTDKDLVDFEMDIYWVVTAGQNPDEWMKRYPGRFKLCHIKDRQKGVAATEVDASVVVGTGQIDFKDILGRAAKAGMEYYIVEQEKYAGTTPLAAVADSAKYIKAELL